MVILIFFILGLMVGSFLNVVVYRLRVAESFVVGRSHCPHCRTQISWYDNIPVLSFILLKFRCRACKEKISWQYPLVEIFTAFIFVFIGHSYFLLDDFYTWIETFYYLGIASFLLVIFVYDFLYMEIPALALWPGVVFAVAFNLFFDWNSYDFSAGPLGLATYSGTLGALAAFFFFFLLVAISKERWMGMGDAYLVIFLGLIVGWPEILLALMASFSLGAIIGLALITFGKKKMESQLPFAPFLVLGTLIAIFWYDPIVEWYLGLFY